MQLPWSRYDIEETSVKDLTKKSKINDDLCLGHLSSREQQHSETSIDARRQVHICSKYSLVCATKGK